MMYKRLAATLVMLIALSACLPTRTSIQPCVAEDNRQECVLAEVSVQRLIAIQRSSVDLASEAKRRFQRDEARLAEARENYDCISSKGTAWVNVFKASAVAGKELPQLGQGLRKEAEAIDACYRSMNTLVRPPKPEDTVLAVLETLWGLFSKVADFSKTAKLDKRQRLKDALDLAFKDVAWPLWSKVE